MSDPRPASGRTEPRPGHNIAPPLNADDLETLRALERKILWLASWTIHNANHVRPNIDGLKVGGHQASSASLSTLMTALYLRILRPQDRVEALRRGTRVALEHRLEQAHLGTP